MKSYIGYVTAIVVMGAIILMLLVNGVDKQVENVKLQNRIVELQKPLPAVDGEVLRNFISKKNDKLYDRLTNEIVFAAIASGERYSIPADLILSVINAESSFNTFAVSKADARGIMQINMDTWGDTLREKKIFESDADVYDPIKNIEAGCFIMRTYLDQTKDFELAMSKYLGVYYKPYMDSISSSAGSLWTMKIAKQIKASYKK